MSGTRGDPGPRLSDSVGGDPLLSQAGQTGANDTSKCRADVGADRPCWHVRGVQEGSRGVGCKGDLSEGNIQKVECAFLRSWGVRGRGVTLCAQGAQGEARVRQDGVSGMWAHAAGKRSAVVSRRGTCERRQTRRGHVSLLCSRFPASAASPHE